MRRHFRWISGSQTPQAAQPPTRFESLADLRDEMLRHMSADGHFPDAAPDPNNPNRIVLGQGKSADVSNLFGYLQAYDDLDVGEEFRKFMSAMRTDEANVEGDISRLVPTLRHIDYLEALRARVDGSIHGTMVDPFVGDMVIIYQYDLPDALRSAKWDDFPGATRDDLRATARKNLAKWLLDLIEDDELSPGFLLVYVDNNASVTPGLLLLEEFWEPFEQRFPDGMLALAPRRDQVFIIDQRLEYAEEVARRLIRSTQNEGFALLSDHVYEVRNRTLHPVFN